jgi:NADPH:quinone reductase-like Zn-dependent oxidoreductase
MTSTAAWILRTGPENQPGTPGELARETLRLPDVTDRHTLVEPIYGSWDANISHAIARNPVDVARQRGEDFILLGNIGVVRVLRPGPGVPTIKEGDLCLLMPFGRRDEFGYVELVYAYDAPGTLGLLAERTVVPTDLLLPLPRDSHHAPHRWTPYARYFTAWDNWRVTHACWRSQMDEADPGEHLVFGWGGGVVLAELELARRAGFRVAMAASTDHRLAQLAAHGIEPIDRRLFPDLGFDERFACEDSEYIERYRRSEKVFLDQIGALSGGRGAAIVLDNIGGSLYKATLKALGRQGVISSCGWKAGMHLRHVRATESIRRHLHVHTHVWRFGDSGTIRDYQETTGWIADIDPTQAYTFDDIPRLAADYAAGCIDSYFPFFQVHPV